MTPSNDLFDLIRSLTKSEKRYFRLFTSRNGRWKLNKYGRLFDLVDAQQEYDEEEIREALAGDAMAHNLAVAKNYLYNSILRALHAFHNEHSARAQIGLLIHEAEILYEKKLYAQFAKILARAKDLSARHEHWHLTIDILTLEYRLLALEQDSAGLERRTDDLLAGIEKTLDVMNDYFLHWGVHARMFAINTITGSPRTPAQLDAFRAVFGSTPSSGESKALTPFAKIYHYHSMALYQRALRDAEGVLESYLHTLAIIDSSPTLQSPQNLIPVLHNICIASTDLVSADPFFTHHARLMSLVETRKESEGFQARIGALNLRATWYAAIGDFDAGVAAFAEVEQALGEFTGKLRLGFEASINFNGFRVNFGAERYGIALDYLNRILNRGASDPSGPAFAHAKMFSLLTHLEMGNHELLEYLVASTVRSLRTRGLAFKAEEVILQYVRRVVRATSDHERADMAVRALEEMESLQSDPFEESILHAIDLRAWFESKSSGRRYRDIVRERYQPRERQSPHR